MVEKTRSQLTDTEAHADECVLASSGPIIKQISFSVSSNMNFVVYEVRTVHIRFDLERYLLNIIINSN